MKRLSVAFVAVLVVSLMAVPAVAQSAVDEVAPIVIDRPPAQPVVDAPVAVTPQITAPAPAQVTTRAAGQLAQTGIDVPLAALLALGLLLAGAVSLAASRRRAAVTERG